MTTKKIIELYFANLFGGDWESLLADDMRFVNNGKENPRGKAVYIEATKRFLQTAKSVQVEHLMAEAGKACALTSYSLRSPKGNTGICQVAEFFEVADGKIQSNEIIFDMAAFREFMAKG